MQAAEQRVDLERIEHGRGHQQGRGAGGNEGQVVLQLVA